MGRITHIARILAQQCGRQGRPVEVLEHLDPDTDICLHWPPGAASPTLVIAGRTRPGAPQALGAIARGVLRHNALAPDAGGAGLPVWAALDADNRVLVTTRVDPSGEAPAWETLLDTLLGELQALRRGDTPGLGQDDMAFLGGRA